MTARAASSCDGRRKRMKAWFPLMLTSLSSPKRANSSISWCLSGTRTLLAKARRRVRDAIWPAPADEEDKENGTVAAAAEAHAAPALPSDC